MNASVADAKARLTKLIRVVESGERVVITRHGKPVAEIGPAPMDKRKARLGGMRGRIKLMPGWEAPVDPERLLEGGL